MSIKYMISENKIVAEPNVYKANVRTGRSIGINEIVTRMENLGTTITRLDILAVLEGMIDVVESYLLEGSRVDLGGLCILSPRIRGKFDGTDDAYDIARHMADVAAQPGCRVRNTIRKNAVTEKLDEVISNPAFILFFDVTSGSINAVVTRGNIGRIIGSRLIYDATQADEGVFFIDAGSEAETKVAHVENNTGKKLVFQIPGGLTVSSVYYLEVRKRFTEGGELRKCRSAAAVEAVD